MSLLVVSAPYMGISVPIGSEGTGPSQLIYLELTIYRPDVAFIYLFHSELSYLKRVLLDLGYRILSSLLSHCVVGFK